MLELNRELERIDREIAGAEARLQAMRDVADAYHAKGARALMLEQEAEDLREVGRYYDAEQVARLARQLRGECEHRAAQMRYESQALAGLRMERKAAERKLQEASKAVMTQQEAIATWREKCLIPDNVSTSEALTWAGKVAELGMQFADDNYEYLLALASGQPVELNTDTVSIMAHFLGALADCYRAKQLQIDVEAFVKEART